MKFIHQFIINKQIKLIQNIGQVLRGVRYMMHNIANQALDLALKYTDQAEIYVEKEECVNVDIKKDKVDFAKEAFTLITKT